MADQHQGQDKLSQPSLGDWQVEKDVIGSTRGCEGFVECLLGSVSLLIEELATDLMLAGQLGDGLRTGEDLEGQVLPLLWRELMGGARSRGGGRDRIGLRGGEEGRSLTQHVCFLCVMARVWTPGASMEETGISEKVVSLSQLLPGSDPGPNWENWVDPRKKMKKGSIECPVCTPAGGHGR